MTDNKTRSGYGKPPEDRQWKKGESGNLAGRPPKPPPTWAQIIEKEWMSLVTLVNRQKKTALELMLLHVDGGIRRGDRRALRCKRKFETLFRKKLQLAYAKDTLEREGDADKGRHKVYKPGPDEPLSEREKKYRAWQHEVETILPKGKSLIGIPLEEAVKLMNILKREPERPTSRDRWRKPRAKNLADTEIFDLVLNSPVLLQQAGRSMRVPRMGGTIKQLVADGAKGNLSCVEMLLDLHRGSTRDGDFGIPKRKTK